MLYTQTSLIVFVVAKEWVFEQSLQIRVLNIGGKDLFEFTLPSDSIKKQISQSSMFFFVFFLLKSGFTADSSPLTLSPTIHIIICLGAVQNDVTQVGGGGFALLWHNVWRTK